MGGRFGKYGDLNRKERLKTNRPLEEKEILSKEQRMLEFAEKIKQLEEDGYILPIQPKNRCALSSKGMLFLDSIAPMFMCF